MWVRRAFYYVQVAAIVVVPAWIVVASALAPAGLGAADILVFLSWPALAIAMVAATAIAWGRKAVRDTKTLSCLDVGALSVWYAVAIAFGVAVALASRLGVGLIGGLLLLVTIAVIWVELWQLVRAARSRVRTVLAGFDRSAVQVGQYDASRRQGDGGSIRIEGPRP